MSLGDMNDNISMLANILFVMGLICFAMSYSTSIASISIFHVLLVWGKSTETGNLFSIKSVFMALR